MGTSQSSNGPGANVALVPPWAEPAPDPSDPPAPEPAPPHESETLPGLPPPGIDPQAPDRRFLGTRRNLGSFAKTGNAVSMRRGIAHYVRNGYGGAGTMSRRLG